MSRRQWLRGNSLAYNDWYYLTPLGDLYRWNRVPHSVNGDYVGFVGPAVYATPTLLLNAAAVAEVDSMVPAEVAWQLDSELHFTADSTWHETYGLQHVKWIAGDRHPLGNQWYFIRSNGSLHAWDGTPQLATGIQIAQLTAAYDNDPVLLTNAIRPVTNVDNSGLVREAFGILRSAVAPAGVLEDGRRALRSEVSSPVAAVRNSVRPSKPGSSLRTGLVSLWPHNIRTEPGRPSCSRKMTFGRFGSFAVIGPTPSCKNSAFQTDVVKFV